MYTLASVCEELCIDKCVGLPVGAIKKNATGKGNATKAEMIAYAKLQGFTPVDDNEADALAILFLALRSTNCQKERVLPGPGRERVASPVNSLASETFARLT
jgi:hypothetical protein